MKLKKYDIIYADPAWSYYNDKTVLLEDNKAKDFISRNPYKVMSTKDIKDLPVKNMSAENSILFIWTTDYHLSRCCEVIKSWGFEYKTVGFAWQKLNKNNKPVTFMGNYTMKSGIELCLLATKGKGFQKWMKKRNVRALIQSKRMEHSRKPDEARQGIEEMFGSNVSKLELFARKNYDGWDSWGNEVENSIDINNYYTAHQKTLDF